MGEHTGKDKNSNLVKHANETGHKKVAAKDLTIMTTQNQQCKLLKNSRTIYIRKLNPGSNMQEMSTPLTLFTCN